MKMVKSLLLASAAGLVATAGAQAADLPVKAKAAVEYVKICSLYGIGFYYIPGTDVCIRIGGHLRSEIGFNVRGSDFQSYGPGNGNTTNTAERDYFFTRQRVFLQTDVRSQTQYGTLRAFSLVRFQNDTLNPYAPAVPVDNYGTATLGLDIAYIQWGGFTVGKLTPSFYDSPWSAYASSYTGQSSGGSQDTTGGVFTVGYTHQFGNGVSGTIALQENKTLRRAVFNAFAALGSAGTGAASWNGGNHSPDIVGNILVGQAWGAFQLSGMARDLTFLYNGATGVVAGAANAPGCPVGAAVNAFGPSCTGKQGDVWGFAGQAALKVNVPTGTGDAVWFTAGYAKGITLATYNSSNAVGIGIFDGPNGGLIAPAGKVYFGYVMDAVFAANGLGDGVKAHLTQSWGVNGTFEHNWNEQWKSAVTAGYQEINYDGTATALLCAKLGVGTVVTPVGTVAASATSGTLNLTSACNMDVKMVAVSTRTVWTPVKDFQIGAEFQWSHWFQQNTGSYTIPQAGILSAQGNPVIAGNQIFQLTDQNIFSGYIAFRRYF